MRREGLWISDGQFSEEYDLRHYDSFLRNGK